MPLTVAFRFSVISLGYLGKQSRRPIGGLLRGDDTLVAQYSLGGSELLAGSGGVGLARYPMWVTDAQGSIPPMPQPNRSGGSTTRGAVTVQKEGTGAGSELVDVMGGDIDLEEYFLGVPEESNSDADAFDERKASAEQDFTRGSMQEGLIQMPLFSLLTGSDFCISIQAGLPLRFAKPQTVTTWSFRLSLPAGASNDHGAIVTAYLGSQTIVFKASDPPLTTMAAFRTPTGRVYAATMRLEAVSSLGAVLYDRELGTIMELNTDRAEADPNDESTYTFGSTQSLGDADPAIPEDDPVLGWDGSLNEGGPVTAEGTVQQPHKGEAESNYTSNMVYPSQHWNAFDDQTSRNACEVLIDGAECFRRYYEVIMQAQYSISLCCWQLNLDFGIAPVTWAPPFMLEAIGVKGDAEWLTIEDVLLWRALCGVTVRVIIWSHDVRAAVDALGCKIGLTGEWNLEAQIQRFQSRCEEQKLKLAVLNQYRQKLDATSPLASSSGKVEGIDIIMIVCKGPNGVYSCFHEKMLLVDAESKAHAYAFIGGFDIADGRTDPPARLRLRAVSQMLGKNGRQAVEATQYRHSISVGEGEEALPTALGGLMYMWHDVQLMLHGHVTEQLFLHFRQRWAHAFHGNAASVMKVTQLPVPAAPQLRHPRRAHTRSRLHHHSTVQLVRGWEGVFNGHAMLEDFCHFILRAESLLYIEHQYIQSPAIARCIRDALSTKPALKVIIVTAVKTDLPVGLVGRLFNATTKGPTEQSMADVLFSIHAVAPDRVGIYGLCWVHPITEAVKTIYVHSKVMIADDAAIAMGSTNLDTFSFFNSSELTAIVSCSSLAIQTRMRLAKEHLGPHYSQNRDLDHCALFNTFKEVAARGFKELMITRKPDWRVVPLAPRKVYDSVRSIAEYPTATEKMMRRVGLATVLENTAQQLRDLGTGALRLLWGSEDGTTRVQLPAKL